MKREKLLIRVMIPFLLLALSSCSISDTTEAPPSPEKYKVTITLDYEEVEFTTNTPMNVFVGGEKLGRQEAGTVQSYTISLEEGDYAFYLKNDGIYKTDEIPFAVTASNCSFSFGAKTRLTFGVEVWDAGES